MFRKRRIHTCTCKKVKNEKSIKYVFKYLLVDLTDFVLSKRFVMWQYFVPTHFIVGAKNSPEKNRPPW